MSAPEVWIEHPELGAGHDIKVPRESLGQYVQRGYRERADQSDPVDEDVVEALAADGHEDHHEDDVDDVEHETPAEDDAPVNNDDPEES